MKSGTSDKTISVSLATALESKPFELSQLIEKHDLLALKNFIKSEKSRSPYDWYYTPVMRQAMRDIVTRGKSDILRIFLEEGFPAHCYVETPEKNGDMTLVYFAALAGQLPCVKLLVENGAPIKESDVSGFEHESIAHDGLVGAVKGGHASVVDYLLTLGTAADPLYSRDIWGELTVLAKAAMDGNIDIVELLIQHGASIKSALELASARFHDRYFSPDDAEKQSYARMVKILLDYSFGIDLDPRKHSAWSHIDYGGIHFLKSLDISEFNFVGISIAGTPITKSMLQEEKLIGAEKAFTATKDISSSLDPRQKLLMQRLQVKLKQQGGTINEDKTVNLIPLWRAAAIGDIATVKARLDAGVDPNEMSEDSESPIVLATQYGHKAVVDLLTQHPKFNLKTLASAENVHKSHKNGF